MNNLKKKMKRMRMNPLNQLLEYMKIHLISLEQDLEMNPESINVVDIEGQIYATKHLLSVADDILMSSNFDDTHYSGGIH